MISKKIGIVVEIADSSEVLDDIRVNVNGQIQRAYNYTKLTGKINIGDEENDPVFCVTDLLPHLAAKQRQKLLKKV